MSQSTAQKYAELSNKAKKSLVHLFPIIDVSGSTEHYNAALNQGLASTLSSLGEHPSADIRLTMIAFNDDAHTLSHSTPIAEAARNFKPLVAGGQTNFHCAFDELDVQLANECSTHESSYKPVILLISDGFKTDSEAKIHKAMQRLRSNRFFKSAIKSAIAMGEGSSRTALDEFTGNPENVYPIQNVTPKSLALLSQLIQLVSSSGTDSAVKGGSDTTIDIEVEKDENGYIIDVEGEDPPLSFNSEIS